MKCFFEYASQPYYIYPEAGGNIIPQIPKKYMQIYLWKHQLTRADAVAFTDADGT